MILTIFFCCRLLFSCRKTVSEYSVPLFHEGSCGQPFLNRYGIIWKSTCSCTLGMYNVFDRYLYSRCIAISKEHLHPYLWLVLSLFQEATWSNLVFSRVLCFFAVIPFFSKVLSWFTILVAVVHSVDGSFSVMKEKLHGTSCCSLCLKSTVLNARWMY